MSVDTVKNHILNTNTLNQVQIDTYDRNDDRELDVRDLIMHVNNIDKSCTSDNNCIQVGLDKINVAMGFENTQNNTLNQNNRKINITKIIDTTRGVSKPWSMAIVENGGTIIPDKSIIFSENNTGLLKIYNTETGSIIEPYTLDIGEYPNDGGEGGVLGIVLHPNFPEKNFLYVVWNNSEGEYIDCFEFIKGSNITLNYIARTFPPSNVVISDGWNHNGSRIIIVEDDYNWGDTYITTYGRYCLLITTGDSGSSITSQNLNSLNGKILRIGLDGSIPTNNPFYSKSGRSEIWTYGHRNPQGLNEVVLPNGTKRIYSTEHGQSLQDEMNVIPHPKYPITQTEWNTRHNNGGAYPTPGANYGWIGVEGFNGWSISTNTVKPVVIWQTPCAVSNCLWVGNNCKVPFWRNRLLVSGMGGFTAGGSSYLGSNSERLFVYKLTPDGLAINARSAAIYVAGSSDSYPGWSDNSDDNNTAFAEQIYTCNTSFTNDGNGLGSERIRDLVMDNAGNIYFAMGGTGYGDTGPHNIFKIH